MRTLTAEQVRWLRVRAQGLAGGPHPARTVAEAVRSAAALQAQAAGPARVQVWSRSDGVSPSDVDAALAGAAIVRTWLMRGTIHAVAAEDLRPMLAVLGPVNLRNGQRRRDQLGLTAALCDRAVTALPAILGGGRALTRAEIVAAWAEHDVVVDPRTQQPPHLLGFAANSALICRGPDAARDEPTYVLLDEWLPESGSAPDRDEALRLLARRYFGSYAPASVADFTTWSGLPAGDAKAAVELIREDLEDVDYDGARLLLPRGAEPALPERPCRLLGRFDPYLLGHRSRDLILDPAFAKRVNAGGGMIAQTMMAEGRIVGVWSGGVLEPFADLSDTASAAFHEEVEMYLKWSTNSNKRA
ncbi:winged helix DNA-binding domain-containing protein [Catenulispora subtropica]|uniref:Winged helix DNA-binding domain-containing protein n=1 Tax=Catenulispora subtropica TaxID=450798 RepID=A0ABP5EA24_9ACTN